MGVLSFVQTVKSTANQNLTTLGGLDWRHWNGFSQNSSTRKTSGAGISDLSAIGSITADQTASARTVSASDPSLSTANSGVFFGANGTTGWGERFTVDVGTTRKKCYIMAGQFSSAVKIDISLSDSSASAISYTYAQSSIYSTDGLLIEFDLEANSAGQTATVDITCSTNIDFGRIGVQAVALSNASAGATYNDGVTESITLSESSSATLSRLSTITESIAATESSNAVGVLTRNIIEAVSLNGSESSSVVFNSLVSEVTTLAEASSARLTIATSINESISFTEASTSTIGGSAYNSTITEAITNTESSNANMVRLGAITESVSLNHTQTASAVLAAQINELITSVESSSARLTIPAIASESFTLNEAQSARLTVSSIVSEPISLLDNTNAGLTYSRSITESITATESSASFMVQVYEVAITEVLNLIDQVDASVIKRLAKRIIGNAISIREGFGNLIKRNIGSNLTERDE